MRILATFRIAARALRRNKMRTILTMLGMIIGVGAVITMVSIGNGAKSLVEAQIASLGQNVILIFSGNFSSGGVRSGWGGAGTLTVEDADAIAREVPGVVAVSPEARDGQPIQANGLNWRTRIMGEGIDYLQIRSWPLEDGAMFGDADVHGATKVCIIGKTIANQLYPNEDIVGKSLRIRNVPFKVLGVLSPKGLSVMGNDQDDTVIVPYTTMMKRVDRRSNLDSIIVQAESSEATAKVQGEIAALLRQQHRIAPGKDDDFTVRNQQEIATAASATTETMTALLASVAIISLIVGGIGIMNIMLVSVTERTREIGIRMAVGARGRDILLQFLIEAVTLSVIGGVIGIGVGIGASKSIAAWKSWPALTPVFWIVVAFLGSALIGIVFGFYPAWKSAKLDPIDALRYE